MITVSSADLFIFSERRAVLVRLPSFEWDFSHGLLVRLRSEPYSLETRQIGTGNHEGRATVLLSPCGDWAEAEKVLQKMTEQNSSVVILEALSSEQAEKGLVPAS